MGTPERIRKLKLSPEANADTLSAAGRAGGLKSAENAKIRRAEDAAFEEAFDMSKQAEAAKMAEERGDDVVPEEDR